MNLNGLSALGWRITAKETFKKTINILQGRQLLRFNCSKTTFTKCCQHPDLLSGSGAGCFYINCNLSWWRDSMWRNKHLCVLCSVTPDYLQRGEWSWRGLSGLQLPAVSASSSSPSAPLSQVSPLCRPSRATSRTMSRSSPSSLSTRGSNSLH